MEFRDYAAKETLALLTRLLAGQAEVSMQQLRALRESLEAAERALEASPQVDGDVQELVGRLNNAAGAVVRRIREEARATIDAAQTQLEQLRSEHTSVTAARDEAEAHVRTLEHDLREERGRAESVERDLDAARDAQARVEAALQEAEAGGITKPTRERLPKPPWPAPACRSMPRSSRSLASPASSKRKSPNT